MKYHLVKNRINTIGPSCKKTSYLTREEAEEMIKHFKETRITRDIRAYKCDVCDGWHLTSRRKKE